MKKGSAELLSYIINSNPILSENIDLPVQGQSIQPIGKVIMSKASYRNAFINTVNVIGVTIIKKNLWDNPWDFTKRGNMAFGQHVREMINDLCDVYDYNAPANDEDRFLQTVVPNILSYIHEINFQKFYQTTTSDAQMAMAFTSEDGLYSLIEDTIGKLYESLKYDEYLVDKYILCRRIVDGTVPSFTLTTTSKTAREIVSQMKSITNKMTFRSPNFNPAGIRKANKFEELITIMDSDFEGAMSTEVLATSFFKDEAELRTNLRLIDGFSTTDEARLTKLLGDAYVQFTDAEKAELAKVKACVIAREWFMDYDYLLDSEAEVKQTDWYSPTTLKHNFFLHKWGVKSSSPFEQCCVFIDDTTPSVDSISVSPSTATVTKGQDLKLSAIVTTTGFANKAVQWAITEQAETSGATINAEGILKVPSGYVNESGTQGVYNLTISTALATGESVTVGGVTYEAAAAADTAAKQATAMYALYSSDPRYTVTNPSSGVVRFTEKSGYYGLGKPSVSDVSPAEGQTTATGVVAMVVGTAGAEASSPIRVTARSIYDDSKEAVALITVS